MKYRIKIIETLSKVEEMVNCEEVVLTADDFEGREFYPVEDYEK